MKQVITFAALFTVYTMMTACSPKMGESVTSNEQKTDNSSGMASQQTAPQQQQSQVKSMDQAEGPQSVIVK